MDFDYSADQRALREEARRFLAAICPVSAVRPVLDDPTRRHDAALWARIGEQGWLGAAIPEEHGGLGLSHADLGVLSEELGRALAPVPFASTAYVLTEALMLAGSPDQKAAWLPRIAAGAVIGCGAFAEGAGAYLPPAPLATAAGGTVSGTKLPVLDGSIADLAVVAAQGGEGVQLGLVELDGPGVRREPLATFDPTCDAARLVFDEAPFEPLVGADTAAALRLIDRAAALYALQQLGGADAALEMATAHVKERHAFGQPIGRFQAVKHKLADLHVANTLARSHAFHALWALDAPGADVASAAAAARLACGEAYWQAAKEGLHLHGAIGFTWEADPQLHYRRAHHLSLALGAPEEWRRRLFERLWTVHTPEANTPDRVEGARGLCLVTAPRPQHHG